MRWIFPITFVATMGAVLWLATYVFNVGWSAAGYEHRSSARAAVPAVAHHETGDAILIVGVSDDTVGAVVQFAAENGIEGVTAIVPTWRAVHGQLMKRMAQPRPTAVVWDYYFRTPQPGDTKFIAGVQALEETGTPVMLASYSYKEDGAPDLSPAIVEAFGDDLRHGAIRARDMVDRPGEFVLATKRGAAVIIPSLALRTLAAILHPEARIDMDWTGREKRLHLLYEIEPGAYLRERDLIELSGVYQAGEADPLVQAEDILGLGGFPLRRPEHWEARSVSYEKLLTSSDDELAALCENKIVVFGDFRMPRFGFAADRHRVKYGTTVVDDVPGCYLLADAIAGLLDRRYTKSAWPPPARTFILMLGFALVGSLVPMAASKRLKLERAEQRRVLWVGLSILAGVSFVVMVVGSGRETVHLGMAGFMLLTPMLGAFWVELARNRHRIVTRERSVIEDLGLLMQGTITLPPRRRTSR
jgi:CHASE2 domain-containing sensor protein